MSTSFLCGALQLTGKFVSALQTSLFQAGGPSWYQRHPQLLQLHLMWKLQTSTCEARPPSSLASQVRNTRVPSSRAPCMAAHSYKRK